jgi:hypothetical protein
MAMLTTAFVTALLQHYFQNADHANVGDAAGLQNSATAGSFFWALHTGDPGDAGSQTTNEIAYTGYGRAPAARSAVGFTVASKNVSPAADVSFGKRTDAGATVTALFWSIGTAVSGAGNLLMRGAIGPSPAPFYAPNNDQIFSAGHGCAVNDRVVFWAYEPGTLPPGITEGVVYWVNSIVSVDVFTFSATQGGANVDVTANGQGLMQRVTPLEVSLNIAPKLETGTALKFQ